MTPANTIQIGGTHYAQGGALQHWDLIDDYDVGYLEGAATKYLVRWRNKDGLRDLQKAAHFLRKLSEKRDALDNYELVKRTPNVPRAALEAFIMANNVTGDEADIITYLLSWKSTGTLNLAAARLNQLIERAGSAEGADADGSYVNQDR